LFYYNEFAEHLIYINRTRGYSAKQKKLQTATNLYLNVVTVLRPYSKSKLELNSKKVELEWYKNFLSVFISFFYSL